MKPEQARRIIDEYGQILSQAAPAGMVMDESRLPYPKSEIKTALLTGLQHASDDSLREMLIAGYTHLAEYQPGVGDQPAGVDPSELKKLGQVEQTEDPLSHARNMLGGAHLEVDWAEKVRTEFAELEQELRAAGHLVT